MHFLNLLKWSDGFWLSLGSCDAVRLQGCMCWAILAFLRWIPLDHGDLFPMCGWIHFPAALLKFLHLYSWGILACSFWFLFGFGIRLNLASKLVFGSNISENVERELILVILEIFTGRQHFYWDFRDRVSLCRPDRPGTYKPLTQPPEC